MKTDVKKKYNQEKALHCNWSRQTHRTPISRTVVVFLHYIVLYYYIISYYYYIILLYYILIKLHVEYNIRINICLQGVQLILQEETGSQAKLDTYEYY